MPEQANWLSDIEIDEVSLVDRPANQHASVVLAKRAPEETGVDYFNENGEAVDIDALEAGEIVYDAEGHGFEITDEDGDELVDERELELAGAVGKSWADAVREDLAKALGDADRDEVVSKALGRVEELSKALEQTQLVAKAERDLRLEREYIAKAETYGLPGVTPAELGRVMKNAAELLPEADCQVLAKAFTAAGSAFVELGTTGAAENARDPFGVIEELITPEPDSALSKALTERSVDAHELIEKAFDLNPEAYDRYLADRRFSAQA